MGFFQHWLNKNKRKRRGVSVSVRVLRERDKCFLDDNKICIKKKIIDMICKQLYNCLG